MFVYEKVRPTTLPPQKTTNPRKNTFWKKGFDLEEFMSVFALALCSSNQTPSISLTKNPIPQPKQKNPFLQNK